MLLRVRLMSIRSQAMSSDWMFLLSTHPLYHNSSSAKPRPFSAPSFTRTLFSIRLFSCVPHLPSFFIEPHCLVSVLFHVPYSPEPIWRLLLWHVPLLVFHFPRQKWPNGFASPTIRFTFLGDDDDSMVTFCIRFVHVSNDLWVMNRFWRRPARRIVC